MDELKNYLNNVGSQISLADIPEIDLYMDQVIQLFENKYSSMKRNDEEKILTKTMINNYAKSKVFFPIKNKKYSKEHLILISLIYQLKGALSINDIKETLEGLNKKITEDDHFELARFYQSYLNLTESNVENFKEEIQKRIVEVNHEVIGLDDESLDYLQRLLLIASFANISSLYKKAAEKLVDEIVQKERGLGNG